MALIVNELIAAERELEETLRNIPDWDQEKED